MKTTSSLLLLGIGTGGVRIARGVSRAFGDELRLATADTDASSAEDDVDFTLLGGDRLSGRGAGGDIVNARMAAEDSMKNLDDLIDEVRLAVIVTCLGGGTGAGATYETVKHLALRGIPTVVFATLPFHFEGDNRQRNAHGIMSMIEESSNATFFLPLDELVSGTDDMNEAMRRATDTVASGVTLFWRLIEKPGYIRLDAERIRHLLQKAGRGRFACVTCQGPDRASEAVDKLIASPILASGRNAVRSILCGILAGDDLRLCELTTISEGIQKAFGKNATFELGTVNDEATFSGRIAVIVLLFENGRNEGIAAEGKTQTRKGHTTKDPLAIGPSGRGRFNNAERTEWHGEDLDIPTYLRQNITLEI